jgi:hypothetical protein
MSKLSASFFRRMTLGMSLVAGVLAAYEDEKFTKEEMVGILNQLFIGLGAEVNFSGLSVFPAEDGGLDIHLPKELMDKLS